MKRVCLLLILATFCFAVVQPRFSEKDGRSIATPSGRAYRSAVKIDTLGDIRGWMGIAGKNIAVSDNGDAVAVVYGGASLDPANFMWIKIGYSLDDGATWNLYGPFSPMIRRCYPGLTATGDFDANYGELFYVWHNTVSGYDSGRIMTMIEEGIPSGPSPSTPLTLPGSEGTVFNPWYPSIAVSPDDYNNLVATGYSFLNNGDLNVYYWQSTDAGYTWSGSPTNLGLGEISDAGPVRYGTGGYVIYAYHDLHDIGWTDSVPVTMYVESTDNGNTWSAPAVLQPPLHDSTADYWWHEMDALVINGEPWIFDPDWGRGDGYWLWHATGSPGAWTWTAVDMYYHMHLDSTVVGDYLYYCDPVQYESISFDPVNNIILASLECIYVKVDNSTGDTIYNGAHVGGAYSTDGGGTWTICEPLTDSSWVEADWYATETAHTLVDGYAYSAWGSTPGNLYFERGQIVPFIGVEESESGKVVISDFRVTPTITPNRCHAAFTMPVSGNVALKLFDATGRLVETVFDGQLNKGSQAFNVNTARLANGTYFLVLETTAGKEVAKIISTH